MGIIIPKSVITIGSNAFDSCTKLMQITIPENVVEIGDNAFYGCTGLEEVNFNAIECTYAGSSRNSVFNGCKNLSTINIGNDVSIIPMYIFSGCTGLTSMLISESVTSIRQEAFYGCTGLEKLTLGSNVNYIGSQAFYNAVSLMQIDSKNLTPPEIAGNTFDNVDKKVCVLNVPINCKDLYVQDICWNEFFNIEEKDFTDNVENIQNVAIAEDKLFYSIDGQKIDTPQKGINIIRYSDGTTKKIIVK